MQDVYKFDLNSQKKFVGNESLEDIGDYKMHFTARVNSFGKLLIGKGQTDYSGFYLQIEKTGIKLYGHYAEDVLHYTKECEIEIGKKLVIDMEVSFTCVIKVSVQFDDQKYTFETGEFSGRNGALFVECDDETSLSDCTYSYECLDIAKPVWIFGDSYLSTNYEKRWTYHLVQKGISHVYLNGFPGRNSITALVALEHSLKYGTPKILVWTLGMNAPSDTDIPDETWTAVTKEVIRICQEKNIKLFLCTIPNVEGRNHRKKNEYVKAFGCPYIDFAKAVGAEENEAWNEGCLCQDKVHPDTEGAKALYNEAVKTCPEILSYNG